MAEHNALIFGTERDKVNCPFYYKIGACRHGDRCARTHNKPLFSQTLLLPNLYVSPDQIVERAGTLGLPAPDIPLEDRESHFDEFYEDIYTEMSRHGRVEAMVVCENRSDHLAGNTYVKFSDEDSAKAALAAIQGRWYAGRQVVAEYSPVTDLSDGKCRKFEEETCERGDFCHFMHARRLPDHLYHRLYAKRPRGPDWKSEIREERNGNASQSHDDDDGRGGRVDVERNGVLPHDQDMPESRDREIDRNRDRDRGYDSDRARQRDVDRVRDREYRVRERKVPMDRDRERDYRSGSGVESRDKDRERERERYGERDRDGEKYQEGDRSGSREWDRDRGRERDRYDHIERDYRENADRIRDDSHRQSSGSGRPDSFWRDRERERDRSRSSAAHRSSR